MSRPPPSLVATLLGGIAAVLIVHGIGRFSYTPLLPLMREDGLNIAQAGWLASANYIGYLLGALFTVWHRGNRVRWLQGGIVVSIATTLAMGVIPAPSLWALIRFVSGVSNGIVFVYASNLVFSRLAKEERGALGGLLYAGVGLGMSISGLLVQGIDALGWRWQWGWLLAGAICIAAVVPAWRIRECSVAASAGAAGKASGRLFWVVGGYGCAGLGYIVSATFLPAIVRDTPGLASFAPMSWIIVGLAATPSSLFWSWLAHRIGELPALLWAYGLQAVGVMAPIWLPGMVGAASGALLLGSTFLGIVTMAMALARRHDPHGGSRTVGLMTSAYGVAQIIGPLLTAALSKRSDGMALALEIATASLVVGAALLIVSAQESQPAAHPQTDKP